MFNIFVKQNPTINIKEYCHSLSQQKTFTDIQQMIWTLKLAKKQIRFGQLPVLLTTFLSLLNDL